MSAVTAGQMLAAARTRSGRELSSVSAETCIRTGILRAIENDDVAALPARVYAIGFVRSYAKALGLDADEIAAIFKSQLDPLSETRTTDAESQSIQPQSASLAASVPAATPAPAVLPAFGAEKTPERVPAASFARVSHPLGGFGRRVTAFAGAFAVVMLAFFGIMLTAGRDDARSIAAAQPKAPALVREAAGREAGPHATAAPKANTVILKADEDVWIRLKRDGETVYEGILLAGSAMKAPEGGPLRMDASNARALAVVAGGQTVARFDGDADIVRDVAL